MRELGVSQLVVATTTDQPLAAKEVSGALSELPLMDKAFRDPSVLDRPVGEVMEPAPPMLGIGETVTDVVDRLESLHRGARARRRPPGGRAHPLRRADVPGRSGTLVKDSMADGFETRAIHDGQAPDPGVRRGGDARSRCRRPSCSEEVGKHSGFEYARSGNPTRARVRGVPGVARGRARTGSRSRAAWRPRTRCCGCSSPASA